MTTPGIGASGIGGLAVEVLPAPTTLTATAAAGGTLVDDEYFYRVTAVNANGETVSSNEDSATTETTNNTVDLTWTAVSGAVSYNIYRSLTTGTGFALLDNSLTNSYSDDGAETPSGAMPTVNTAFATNVYTAPTKFFPFNSESLTTPQATVWRRPIRQSADIIGAVPGNFNVEGDIVMEALEDVVPYFLMASRTAVDKTDASPNYTYEFTPTAAAIATITLSLTIVRNGQVFGYRGCTVGSFNFGITDGLLTFTVNIIGSDESTETLPTPVWPTTTPFGAGQYDIEIPTGTTVRDTDTFEWMIEDNAEPQFRLKSDGRGSEFTKFGERAATMTLERDFLNKDDYADFKTLTQEDITITATKGVNNYIELNAPVAIKDTYEVSLSGQGDLVRASVAYNNIIDASGNSFTITIGNQEDITVPA